MIKRLDSVLELPPIVEIQRNCRVSEGGGVGGGGEQEGAAYFP